MQRPTRASNHLAEFVYIRIINIIEIEIEKISIDNYPIPKSHQVLSSNPAPSRNTEDTPQPKQSYSLPTSSPSALDSAISVAEKKGWRGRNASLVGQSNKTAFRSGGASAFRVSLPVKTPDTLFNRTKEEFYSSRAYMQEELVKSSRTLALSLGGWAPGTQIAIMGINSQPLDRPRF